MLTSALDGLSKGYRRLFTTISDTVAQGVESLAQNVEMVAAVPEVPHSASTAQQCHYCSAEGSMLDHTCPLCQTLVCTSCVSTHRSEDQRCPGCLDATSNERSMRFLLRSKEARSAASSLWGSITAFGVELWGCNNMPKTSKSWNDEEDHSAMFRTVYPQTSIGRSTMKDDRGSDPFETRRPAVDGEVSPQTGWVSRPFDTNPAQHRDPRSILRGSVFSVDFFLRKHELAPQAPSRQPSEGERRSVPTRGHDM